ncbi:hypothetical protein [Caulobacter sp. BE254]|uniref:hypothetical protein n=1 Tax=Caulobacter sp. BE254 TaxID=2817720 RepID=UPI002858C01F|nr:hypothetical protein [Caulobacter sp. BE254]MDR7117405.1 hypothetical protein [Caulobacter sp. BE254]
MDQPQIVPFPTGDEREFGYGVAKVTLGAIPGVGGVAQELLDKMIGSPLRRRQEAWFAELGLALADLTARVEGLDPETLARDEAFVSTVARATQMALASHGQVKREALRNVVLNTAAGVRLDEVLLGAFLSYVERFSEGHLKLLALLADPMADPAYAKEARSIAFGGSIHGIIAKTHPDLGQSPALLDRLYADLAREDLVGGSFKAMMTGGGLQSPQTTEYGLAFIDFIRAPQV